MKLWRHERALLLLQVGMLAVLVVRAGVSHPATLTIFTILAVHVAVLMLLVPRTSRVAVILRLGSAYPVALALYGSFSAVTPAVGFPLWDAPLLAADRAVFGETPALLLQPIIHPLLTELMSACYLSYHFYLHGLLVLETLKPRERALAFAESLFTAFAVGYAGYFLFPAVGPLASSFSVPLEGGVVTGLNSALVARGGAVFDAFPSLHVLITFTLLAHDARHTRRRFWCMVPVVAGLVMSTVYLRYHDVADLLAGALIFAALEWGACHSIHRRTIRSG